MGRLESQVHLFDSKIKQYTIEQRAYLRALAAFRHCFFDTMFGVDSLPVFEAPCDNSKNACTSLYQGLLLLQQKNHTAHQKIESLIKSGFKPHLYNAYQHHAQMLNDSIELWMVTVAIGINSELYQEIEDVWQKFAVDKTYYLQAIDNIKAFEHQLSMATKQQASLCESLDNEQWLELCLFRPKINPSG